MSFHRYILWPWGWGLDTQGLETDNSYQDDKSSLVVLTFLDIDKVRLYSDTETVTGISVEGMSGKVVEQCDEHSRGGLSQHIKDSLRQDFFNEYEGSWTTQPVAKSVSSVQMAEEELDDNCQTRATNNDN